MHTIKNKTKDEKQAFIQDFLASGKFKTVWCKEMGMPYSTFYEWLKVYDSALTTVTFVPPKENKVLAKGKTTCGDSNEAGTFNK